MSAGGLWWRLSAGQLGSPRELRMLDGHTIVLRVQRVVQGAQGGGCNWFHDDVTQGRRPQKRALQALHGPLTVLVNRLPQAANPCRCCASTLTTSSAPTTGAATGWATRS